MGGHSLTDFLEGTGDNTTGTDPKPGKQGVPNGAVVLLDSEDCGLPGGRWRVNVADLRVNTANHAARDE
jgi:hypothetical protein